MTKQRTLRLCFGRECVPMVKLMGKWLKEFGFEVGDCIKIASPEPGVMVIKNTGNPDRIMEVQSE